MISQIALAEIQLRMFTLNHIVSIDNIPLSKQDTKQGISKVLRLPSRRQRQRAKLFFWLVSSFYFSTVDNALYVICLFVQQYAPKSLTNRICANRILCKSNILQWEQPRMKKYHSKYLFFFFFQILDIVFICVCEGT